MSSNMKSPLAVNCLSKHFRRFFFVSLYLRKNHQSWNIKKKYSEINLQLVSNFVTTIFTAKYICCKYLGEHLLKYLLKYCHHNQFFCFVQQRVQYHTNFPFNYLPLGGWFVFWWLFSYINYKTNLRPSRNYKTWLHANRAVRVQRITLRYTIYAPLTLYGWNRTHTSVWRA